MLKRFFFTPVCLVVLAVMLSACDFAVHAKDAHTNSPAAKSAVTAATPSPVQSTAVAPASPVVQSTAVVSPMASASTGAVTTDPPIVRAPTIASAPRPSPVLPTFSPDPGTHIIYNGSGAQGGRNESRTVNGSFPATPGFLVHIICRGYGLIKVEVSSGIINELSCPQSDNVNEYYTDPAPSPRYAIRVTAMGAIVWRVVVEAAD